MANKDLTDELLKLFESADGVMFMPKAKPKGFTADDRLIESFQEIIDFVSKNSRRPEINSTDFSEALLAKRLDSIRNTQEKVTVLEEYDTLGLLELAVAPKTIEELIENDTFGIFSGEENKIFEIKNVDQRRVENSVENKAVTMLAKDFAKYKPLFAQTHQKLESGENKLVLFTTIEQLHKGRFYVNSGQMVYVAEEGEIEKKAGYVQQRLRVIIENGTESNMYRRSLAQRLYEGGSCVVGVDEILGGTSSLDEVTKGYIYIVRSLSTDPKINTISNLYKIGFSTTPISQRIAGAKDDPTYLMAEVELVESYRLTGDYNPQKVEHMIHRVFADSALDLKIIDKNGLEYKPLEWYSVPIHIVREVIELIDSGEIVHYTYDSEKQKVIPIL